ncbi:MAG: UDP-N-acetylglucosamine 1-carboxyvinyltransferase [Patescibacteria group bacterium]
MSENFIIQGLAGEKKLKGTVTINGAKNAVLKAIPASILFRDEVSIKNIPNTDDVKKLSTILTKIGATISLGSDHSGKFNASTITSTDIDHDLAQSMRASVVLTGPMLGRYGRVTFPAPGGCVIGTRPIDLFLSGYEKMGAKVELVEDSFVITAPKDGLKAAEIFFPIQTVGGTETLMMAAVLAHGTTILKNCALEPEIVNLAEYLVACGAKIEGIGTTTLRITGAGPQGLLESKGKEFVTIPDRIEAASFLFLGAVCAEELTVASCNPAHLEAVTSLLQSCGVKLEIGQDYVKIFDNTIDSTKLKSMNVRTHEYPGFPTDVQAPLVVFLAQTGGESMVFETIYEGRFKYTQDLIRMGSDITVMNPREILIRGGKPLTALHDEIIQAFDIRAGFATVIAALNAKGTSTICNIHLIDRGYEALEKRLQALGAKIERVKAK